MSDYTGLPCESQAPRMPVLANYREWAMLDDVMASLRESDKLLSVVRTNKCVINAYPLVRHDSLVVYVVNESWWRACTLRYDVKSGCFDHLTIGNSLWYTEDFVPCDGRVSVTRNDPYAVDNAITWLTTPPGNGLDDQKFLMSYRNAIGDKEIKLSAFGKGATTCNEFVGHFHGFTLDGHECSVPRMVSYVIAEDRHYNTENLLLVPIAGQEKQYAGSTVIGDYLIVVTVDLENEDPICRLKVDCRNINDPDLPGLCLTHLVLKGSH